MGSRVSLWGRVYNERRQVGQMSLGKKREKQRRKAELISSGRKTEERGMGGSRRKAGKKSLGRTMEEREKEGRADDFGRENGGNNYFQKKEKGSRWLETVGPERKEEIQSRLVKVRDGRKAGSY